MLRHHPSQEFPTRPAPATEPLEKDEFYDYEDESSASANKVEEPAPLKDGSVQYRNKLVFLNYFWKHSLTKFEEAQGRFGVDARTFELVKSLVPSLQRWCEIKSGSSSVWDLGFESKEAYFGSREYKQLVAGLLFIAEEKDLAADINNAYANNKAVAESFLERFIDPLREAGRPEMEPKGIYSAASDSILPSRSSLSLEDLRSSSSTLFTNK